LKLSKGKRLEPVFAPVQISRSASAGRASARGPWWPPQLPGRVGVCTVHFGRGRVSVDWAGREMGRRKVGRPRSVVIAAGTRYRLGPIEASYGRFNERHLCRETFRLTASDGGHSLAVAFDRWLSPRGYHQLVRDADKMASIDPSCNTDQVV